MFIGLPNKCSGMVGVVQFTVFFAAFVTDRFLGAGSCAAGVLAAIATVGANAVFPSVGVGRGAPTAIPSFFVFGFGLSPSECAGMVGWVHITVGFAANIADGLLGTGRPAAHVIANIAAVGAFAVYPIVRHKKEFILMTAGQVF